MAKGVVSHFEYRINPGGALQIKAMKKKITALPIPSFDAVCVRACVRACVQ